MYIKKLKDFILITYDDYTNERYITQHDEMILYKFWPAFVQLVKFYIIIGLTYIIIYNSLAFHDFNEQSSTFYLYTQIGGSMFIVYIACRIARILKEQHRLKLFIFTFILIETSFQLFLIQMFVSNDSDSKILTIGQLFINLLLILGIVRSMKLRIFLLLKFYIYFIIRGITFPFQTFQTLHILLFILFIIYFWDQQLINLSKVSLFADSTLKSIPSAVCVLDCNGKEVLFSNNYTKKMINQVSLFGNTATKSLNVLNQQFPSHESILTSQSSEVISFFENLYVSCDELKDQLFQNSQSKIENPIQLSQPDQLNINQALFKIQESEKLTQGNIFTFRCQYENPQISTDYPVIIEVRIRTKLQYGQSKNAILLNLYDVSQNFKSSYYKNLNQFKSQVIRSISHELRTRLNVIQGILQVIQCSATFYDKETNKLLRAAFNNCRIQNMIISSIINYNLIKEKKLVTKIEKCKLSTVIQEVVDLFQEEAELKDIKIIFYKLVNQSQYEMLDYEQFQSILIHLISNSLKFGKKGGQIFITLTKSGLEKQIAQKEQKLRQNSSQIFKSQLDLNDSSYYFPLRKNTVMKPYMMNFNSQFSNNLQQNTNTHFYESYTLEIKDNGIGMSQSQLEYIQNLLKDQEQFNDEQFDDRSSGMKLGLRASNQLIKYLSGKEDENYITIDSAANQGTTVSIHLKCKTSQLTEVFPASELQNKESSQIELEGGIAEYNNFNYKFNFWTDPDISSRTNIIKSNKTPSLITANLLNNSVSQKKKGSIQMSSNNHLSSVLKVSGGSKIFQTNACTCEQKIVIVDDEPYNLLVLESLLKNLGYLSIKADNGQQCLQLIEKSINTFEEHKCKGYKGIIMDYQMPIMNGQEATRQILLLLKEYPRVQIPIFGLTGFSGEDDLINLLDAGMKQVFIKPITLKTLEEMINSLNFAEALETSRQSSKQFHCIELDYANDLDESVNE